MLPINTMPSIGLWNGVSQVLTVGSDNAATLVADLIPAAKTGLFGRFAGGTPSNE